MMRKCLLALCEGGAAAFSPAGIPAVLMYDMAHVLVVAVSQSGTTTDTNRTVDLARERGAATIGIVMGAVGTDAAIDRSTSSRIARTFAKRSSP